jgi:hypothetical protein
VEPSQAIHIGDDYVCEGHNSQWQYHGLFLQCVEFGLFGCKTSFHEKPTLDQKSRRTAAFCKFFGVAHVSAIAGGVTHPS